MCFTVQLSRLSVFASRLTAHLLYHLLFALSRTFLFYFLSSFSSASATLIQYHVFSFLSTLFLYFFQLYSTNLCCLSKKIRLTQKRIYHIIIFFLRQVLFYIFLHIFYAISDIAIISSFLTPQYQSKDLKIVRICAGRHSDPIPTVHRYQTFLIEDTHKYPDQDISVIYETQDAIFLNDLKGRLTSLCIAHNGESQKDNPYYYKEFNCPQQRSCYLVHAMQHR